MAGLPISYLPLAFYQRQPGLRLQKPLVNFYNLLRDFCFFFRPFYRRDDSSDEKRIQIHSNLDSDNLIWTDWRWLNSFHRPGHSIQLPSCMPRHMLLRMSLCQELRTNGCLNENSSDVVALLLFSNHWRPELSCKNCPQQSMLTGCEAEDRIFQKELVSGRGGPFRNEPWPFRIPIAPPGEWWRWTKVNGRMAQLSQPDEWFDI